MIVQLHKQNRADPTKTELIEWADIQSIEQQQEWLHHAMEKHGRPNYESDWNWLICTEGCSLFKRSDPDEHYTASIDPENFM